MARKVPLVAVPFVRGHSRGRNDRKSHSDVTALPYVRPHRVLREANLVTESLGRRIKISFSGTKFLILRRFFSLFSHSSPIF
jgi:hypothetical protein